MMFQKLVRFQIEQWYKNSHPDTLQWFETKRKTTHIIFWS